jgi:hypothetical protein
LSVDTITDHLQFALAQALPSRFRWALVVLTEPGGSFSVLQDSASLDARIQSARVRYQIELKMPDPPSGTYEVVEFLTSDRALAASPTADLWA